jgi:hypothetical protein
MSLRQIQIDADNAMREVAREVGNGEFVAELLRPGGTPSQPWEAPTTSTTIEYTAIEMGISRALVDGTLIKASDRFVWLTALDKPEPKTSDKLRIRGETEVYSILDVDIKQNAGGPYYYVCQLRI